VSGYTVQPADVAGGISRRRLLGAAGVMGAAAAAVTVPALHRAAPSLDVPGVDVSATVLAASTFTALVGKPMLFAIHEADPVPLTLAAVEGLGSAAATEQAFALRFEGPEAAVQGGQTGHLGGSGLAPTELFIVPSGPPVQGRQTWVATIVGASHD
jgi:hypothetical protein